MTAHLANSLGRRLTRFSLRSLLVMTVVASLGLAWYSHHYRNYQTELRFIDDLVKLQKDKPVDFGTQTTQVGFMIASSIISTGER